MINTKGICLFILLLTLCQTLVAQVQSDALLRSTSADPLQTPNCTAPTQALVLFCDGSTPTSTSFDFNNAGQTQFQYSYSVDGGAPVTGSFNSPSHFAVTGLSPGQAVTFTLTWAGLCGTNTKTVTCTAECTNTTMPNFAAIPALCAGSTTPVLQSTSPNGVSGTWNPATVSNTASGTYTFTPTSACSSSQSLTVTVLPKVTPAFAPLQPVCQNSPAPVLPQVSTNVPPVTGTWSPAVSTASVGTRAYTFTPDAGQCTVSTPVTLSLTVVQAVIPNFPVIPPFCSGATPPVLAATSPNGITGTWSPAIIDPANGHSYTFTPDSGQCAAAQVLTTTVTPSPQPTFNPITPFCAGSSAPALPFVSNEGVSGTWSPSIVDNMQSGTYQFIPNPNQCAAPTTLSVTVMQRLNPGFEDVNICHGEQSPILSSISPSGVHGSWSPAVVDNLASGAYVFTPFTGECANTQTIQATVSSATLTAVDYAISDAFADNTVLTVLATSSGNYLYQLDSGPLSTSNTFHHVGPGTHAVTVYDVHGCSDPITVTDIQVINYPHYFTPNADGTNDFWKITGLANDTVIYIFDRYGKLIEQLNPDGNGWDGTFLGTPLPSTDYWFSIQYYEKNKSKIFTSHFTLKR
ncbi:MAG TPA: T9SS type B sorting domain-containing protein [Flavobacterium sp.]|jgi:gliding motility-associated-like protein